jgi:REP element-mobilizing transposase RayT
MTMARKHYVKEGHEAVYHCFSRCVRRAFLFGSDQFTHQDYSHRKELLLARLRLLASVFLIEVCAFALLENHYHLILRTRPDLIVLLSNKEIAARWLLLCPIKDLNGNPVSPTEKLINALAENSDRIAELRRRLISISWFMAKTNEHLARTANKEDHVTGRFWEGRFKCRVLLDETAIVSAMVYVDLNPIRSGLAATPEKSDFTSIQERITAWQKEQPETAEKVSTEDLFGEFSDPHVLPVQKQTTKKEDPITSIPSTPTIKVSSDDSDWLCPIQSTATRRGILHMTAEEYYDLLDKSGRLIRSGKRGAIDPSLKPILTRIGANSLRWHETITSFDARFYLACGLLSSLRSFASHLGRHWLKGVASAHTLFSPTSQKAL